MKRFIWVLIISSNALGVEPERLDRCGWGYRSALETLTPGEPDPFAPEASPRELCRVYFEDDQLHPSHAWVSGALSLFEIPPGATAPTERITAEGNCRLGAALFKRRHHPRAGSPEVRVFSSNLCRKLPPGLR